ncbi:MAG: tRNA uridine-5-carboxymethylaminomethyl(34) synthesis GTPase MnmE [Candidatus Sumerlaeia bacterium]|nr:tRNA uridine-5-carboxymethylaminomethyl(34) synthesis GTPase MnmE [Candidatus Sumerlaeia bacterium]
MARNTRLDSDVDLIVAPATAPGRGAIAVIRLSGNGALEAGGKLAGSDLEKAEPGRLLLSKLRNPNSNQFLDQSLVVAWKGPRSYTGEDMVEFHIHGSPAVIEAVMEASLLAGARHATPGEFTRRAFLNGKMDLAQAEAVEALATSQTESARRAALTQLQGGLSKAVLSIRKELIRLTAMLEAAVDYPEEDLPEEDKDVYRRMVSDSMAGLAELEESYNRGRRLREGARLVFAGLPNAGKSSLFNALLRRERAIVSPHPGTTRDTLEAVIDLKGIPLTLVDTAGLRDNPDEIEALGIQRTREAVEEADLALFLVDASATPQESLAEYRQLHHHPHLLVYNKIDSHPTSETLRNMDAVFGEISGQAGIHLSTKSRQGMTLLEERIIEELTGGASEGGSEVMLTSQRHVEAIRRALDALGAVRQGIDDGLSPEFVVMDLQEVLSQLDAVTGLRELDEDILDVVFSTFCLGK